MTHGISLMRDNAGNPTILQATVNGWKLTWNPDDGRIYVHHPAEGAAARATFAELRNAVQYAQKHKLT